MKPGEGDRPGEEQRLLEYFADLDREKGICWLDDVKHPRLKVGNRRAFRILPEAIAIIDRQPADNALIFPYNSKTIGALFTRATRMLGIEDLTFHDLRHESTSRLFERGYAIHEVAQFTLHDSWATLRIYANLRPEDVRALPAKDATAAQSDDTSPSQ